MDAQLRGTVQHMYSNMHRREQFFAKDKQRNRMRKKLEAKKAAIAQVEVAEAELEKDAAFIQARRELERGRAE